MICKQPDQTSSSGQRSVPDFLQFCSWTSLGHSTKPIVHPMSHGPIWQFCEWRRKSWTGLNGIGLELLVFLSCYIVLIRSAFLLHNTDWLYLGGTAWQYLCTFPIFNQANMTIDLPGRRMDVFCCNRVTHRQSHCLQYLLHFITLLVLSYQWCHL